MTYTMSGGTLNPTLWQQLCTKAPHCHTHQCVRSTHAQNCVLYVHNICSHKKTCKAIVLVNTIALHVSYMSNKKRSYLQVCGDSWTFTCSSKTVH